MCSTIIRYAHFRVLYKSPKQTLNYKHAFESVINFTGVVSKETTSCHGGPYVKKRPSITDLVPGIGLTNNTKDAWKNEYLNRTTQRFTSAI